MNNKKNLFILSISTHQLHTIKFKLRMAHNLHVCRLWFNAPETLFIFRPKSTSQPLMGCIKNDTNKKLRFSAFRPWSSRPKDEQNEGEWNSDQTECKGYCYWSLSLSLWCKTGGANSVRVCVRVRAYSPTELQTGPQVRSFQITHKWSLIIDDTLVT